MLTLFHVIIMYVLCIWSLYLEAEEHVRREILALLIFG